MEPREARRRLVLFGHNSVPNQPGEVRYDYFLVSDATLREDHTWEEGKYSVTAMANYQ